MCRNHRGFIDATVACAKLGARALYLNTAFAGPQIADVLAREGPRALIYDEEFAGLLEQGGSELMRFVAWREPGEPSADPLLEELITPAPSPIWIPPPSRVGS